MTCQELHKILSDRFPGSVGEWTEVKAGDPFINVSRESLASVCTFLKNDPACAFDFMRLISGVDWGDRLGVVYHLYSYTHNHTITIHVDVPKESPSVASVSGLWPTADWMEREAYDMMGIVFEGHGYLKRILLPLDWEGFPLRKDYKEPQTYHGVKHG